MVQFGARVVAFEPNAERRHLRLAQGLTLTALDADTYTRVVHRCHWLSCPLSFTRADDAVNHLVFMSYSTIDGPVAAATVSILEAAQYPCWFAPRDVPSGAEFGAHIVAAIESARVLVLIYSSASLASPHVQREISLAVSMGKSVVPVRIADVRPEGTMRYFLQPFQFLDALGNPIDRYLEKLPAAIAGLLARNQAVSGTHEMPWMQHLKVLSNSGQITSALFDQVSRILDDADAAQGYLLRRDDSWLAEVVLTRENALVQRTLTALTYGLDPQLRLLDIDFSLIPPGRPRGTYENRQPFYLSQLAFTAEELSALAVSEEDIIPGIDGESGLCLAVAEEILQVLNDCLAHATASRDRVTAKEDLCAKADPPDLYWFRLPNLRELDFVAAVNGNFVQQRCLREADLKAIGRHSLGVSGLVGGYWQFCSGPNIGDRFAWGGTMHTMPTEFLERVPAIRCLNSLMESPEQAVRIVVEPVSQRAS